MKPKIKIVYLPDKAPYIWGWKVTLVWLGHGERTFRGAGIPNYFETIGEAIRKATTFLNVTFGWKEGGPLT